MFSGPGGWIPQYFLCNMTVFGFPVQLRSLDDAILASQVRTAHNLSMDTDRIATEFGLAYLAFKTRHGDSHVHSTWHAHAFIANLGSASQTCKAECESQGCEFSRLVASKEGKWLVQQKKVMKLLGNRHLSSKRGALIECMRNRLQRIIYRLRPLHLRHAADRAYNRLSRLHKLVKPAVQVGYFRTILNGWVTGRRMRTCNNISIFNLPSCPMCGTPHADSLEHIIACPVTLFAFRCMGAPISNAIEFLALDHRCTTDKVLALRARALSIVYTVYNTLSHHAAAAPPLCPYALIRAVAAR